MKALIMTPFQKFQAICEDDHKAGILVTILIVAMIVVGIVLNHFGIIHIPTN